MMKRKIRTVPFSHGNIVMTRGVANHIDMADINQCISRHIRCDWGDISDADWMCNTYALMHRERLLSRYNLSEYSVYVITERDRSVTTILLTDEY